MMLAILQQLKSPCQCSVSILHNALSQRSNEVSIYFMKKIKLLRGLIINLLLTHGQAVAGGDSPIKFNDIGFLLETVDVMVKPLYKSEKGMQRYTQTQKFQEWKTELKELSDKLTDIEDHSRETQFGHAIELFSDRLEQDIFPMSGYLASNSENKRVAREEEKKLERAIESSPYLKALVDKYQVNPKKLSDRKLGPVFASQLHREVNDNDIANEIKTIEDFLKITPFSKSNKSCQDICPDNQAILALNRGRAEINPSAEETQQNFTAFRNTHEDFDDFIVKQFGFCWGQTSTLYKFKQYAVFKPESQKDTIDDVITKFRRLIREEKFVQFNGYKSLREMSDGDINPEIKIALMREIAREWARNATTIRSARRLGPARHAMKLKNYAKVYNEIVSRILTNQIVQIKFNAHEVHGWSHIINVYGFEETKNELRLYVEDPNLYPEQVVYNEQYPLGNNYIAIKKKKYAGKGFAYYPELLNVAKLTGSQRVGEIEITREGKIQISQTIDNLRKICINVTGCKL